MRQSLGQIGGVESKGRTGSPLDTARSQEGNGSDHDYSGSGQGQHPRLVLMGFSNSVIEDVIKVITKRLWKLCPV